MYCIVSSSIGSCLYALCRSSLQNFFPSTRSMNSYSGFSSGYCSNCGYPIMWLPVSFNSGFYHVVKRTMEVNLWMELMAWFEVPQSIVIYTLESCQTLCRDESDAPIYNTVHFSSLQTLKCIDSKVIWGSVYTVFQDWSCIKVTAIHDRSYASKSAKP